MFRRGALVAVLLAGCYEPPDSCGITCVDECPGDLRCENNVCVPADGTSCEAPAIAFAAVSAGARHVCGLDTLGTAYCWGDNRTGQLGLDTMTPFITRPTALSGTWTAIAAGGNHTCGIRDGQPFCWGYNNEGQVLAQSGGMVLAPEEVPFGPVLRPTFTTIAAGARHSCAIGDGQLWCWGAADQIGTDGMSVSVATRIGTLADWTHVALGTHHGCGISTSMGILCWGESDRGEASNPATPLVGTPSPVTGLPAGTALALDTGDLNTCAVISTSAGTTGELWCWGESYIIDEMFNQIRPPTKIGPDAEWSSVTIGNASVCGALRGRTYCWGDASWGGLGTGLWNDRRAYGEAFDAGVVDHVELSARSLMGFNDRFGCHLAGGELRCFGENAYGQLGLGMLAWYPTPAEVLPPSGRTWTHVWSGDQHSCATTDDGALRCWGANERGQVGGGAPRGEALPCVDGEPCDFARPTPAPSPVGVPEDVVVGYDYTCTREGGTVHCWGEPSQGHLGANITTHGPTTLTPAGGAIAKLSGGAYATCGIQTDGGLTCWGQVAGMFRPTPSAVAQTELQNVVDVTSGDNWLCAARADNTRACWGQNDQGQFGDGSQNPQTNAIAISNPTITSLSNQFKTVCALTTTGGVSCWGQNDAGQTGATANPTLTPSAVTDATNAAIAGCTAVEAAGDHACAICGGQPLCWGRNEYGELGRGLGNLTSSRRAGRVDVPTELTYTEVSTTDSGGCALSSDGRLFCWGDSTRGQVGAGGSARNIPTRVGSTP